MQYQGGKHIAAPHLVEASGLPDGAGVLEPFVGGGSVTVALAKAGHYVWASDTNASLILMWQKAMKEDLQEFPLDAESYQRWKTAPDSAEKAIVGIGASFRGKWFGGMARTEGRPSFVQQAVRSVNKQAAVLRGWAEFRCMSYLDLPETEGFCYYLDKPYEGVTKHFGGEFDHKRFWEWVRERGKRNLLFISEYQAPFGRLIWERETPLSMAAASGESGRTQLERLYKVGKL